MNTIKKTILESEAEEAKVKAGAPTPDDGSGAGAGAGADDGAGKDAGADDGSGKDAGADDDGAVKPESTYSKDQVTAALVNQGLSEKSATELAARSFGESNTLSKSAAEHLINYVVTAKNNFAKLDDSISPEDVGQLIVAAYDDDDAIDAIESGNQETLSEVIKKYADKIGGSVVDEDKSSTPNLDKMETDPLLKPLAEQLRVRFRDKIVEGDKLAGFISTIVNEKKGPNSIKWHKFIEEYGKDKAVVQNKIIPTFIKSYNSTVKDDEQIGAKNQIDDDARQDISDSQNRKVGNVVIPNGFNQSPVEFGNRAFLVDIGYPTINYSSEFIKELLNETDPKRKNKLLKAVIKHVKGTPAEKALVSFFGSKKKLFNVIKNLSTAKGMPMIRKPVKVPSEELIGDSQQSQVSVIPLNQLAGRLNEKQDANQRTANNESVYYYTGDAVFESANRWDEYQVNYVNALCEAIANQLGEPTTVPKEYLKQFYEVMLPSGASGIRMYAKFLSTDDQAAIAEQIGEDELNRIKSSNRNINEALLQAYIKKTNGVPPYYILTARKTVQERMRVMDENLIGNYRGIKCIAGPNKAFGYLLPEKAVNALFEIG